MAYNEIPLLCRFQNRKKASTVLLNPWFPWVTCFIPAKTTLFFLHHFYLCVCLCFFSVITLWFKTALGPQIRKMQLSDESMILQNMLKWSNNSLFSTWKIEQNLSKFKFVNALGMKCQIINVDMPIVIPFHKKWV